MKAASFAGQAGFLIGIAMSAAVVGPPSLQPCLVAAVIKKCFWKRMLAAVS